MTKLNWIEQVEKRTKYLNRHVINEDIKMEKDSMSLFIREMKIKMQ